MPDLKTEEEAVPSCTKCSKPAPVHFYCDEVEGGPWCGECFDAEACERDHGEGCSTTVFCGS